MTRRRGPRWALAAALAAAAASAPAGTAAAHAEQCHGVTVVVDFSREGEPPVVGCADDPGSGLDALTQAGFTVNEVTSFPGLVCRIDGHPDTECGAAPPTDQSWSYWHADPADEEWMFSTVGAAAHDPDEGDIEGWAFGDASAPPTLDPGEAAHAEVTEASEEETGASPTWIIAVVALSAIAGLVIWRLRRDRRA